MCCVVRVCVCRTGRLWSTERAYHLVLVMILSFPLFPALPIGLCVAHLISFDLQTERKQSEPWREYAEDVVCCVRCVACIVYIVYMQWSYMSVVVHGAHVSSSSVRGTSSGCGGETGDCRKDHEADLDNNENHDAGGDEEEEDHDDGEIAWCWERSLLFVCSCEVSGCRRMIMRRMVGILMMMVRMMIMRRGRDTKVHLVVFILRNFLVSVY